MGHFFCAQDENMFVKFKISTLKNLKQNIDETNLKQPNPYQPMDFKNLNKKSANQKSRGFCPNLCDFH
jgi:hypothetical protein